MIKRWSNKGKTITNQMNQGTMFQFVPGSFFERSWKVRIASGLGQVSSWNWHLSPKKMLTEFDIRLRENYLTAINNYRYKLNRVDLLLAHDRRLIWHQVQAAHHSVDANNWKEKVQTLGYFHRTVINYINFFNLCELYPRILTSSAYFSEWCTFFSGFEEALKKNNTLSTRCAKQLMMEEFYINFDLLKFI